jgi:hypothetical protein
LFITILLFLSLFLQLKVYAQEPKLEPSDTLKVDSVKFHSPTKATLYSVALPGLGQVYNKKYWKVPIIYAGMGVSIYFAISNQTNYQKYKTAYINRTDNDESTVVIEELSDLTNDNLSSGVDYYKRNRDLSYIIAGLIYVLNIVDASVDAHLFTFPKNDNLSFNLQPTLQLTQNNHWAKGLSLVIKL